MNLLLINNKKVVRAIPFDKLEIDENNVKYEDKEGPAALEGIKLDFYVVEELYEEGRELSDEEMEFIKTNDKKEKYIKLNLEEENKILKQENEMNAIAIMELAQFMMGGDV